MKRFALLAVIFSVSVMLTSCGGMLSIDEFETWKNDYVSENSGEHSELQGELKSIDSKVSQQKESLERQIDTALDRATERAESSDAESIDTAKKFATEEDDKLRREIASLSDRIGSSESSRDSREDDQRVFNMVGELQNRAKTQAVAIEEMQTSFEEKAEEIISAARTEMASMKPTKLATIQFKSGTVGLSSKAKQEVDSILQKIEENPDAVILVVGHTDGSPVLSGKYRSNWDLSQARADSVAKYLAQKGLPNEIKSVGRGHTQPVDSVNTKAGRNKNRRVEIILAPSGSIAM